MRFGKVFLREDDGQVMCELLFDALHGCLWLEVLRLNVFFGEFVSDWRHMSVNVKERWLCTFHLLSGEFFTRKRLGWSKNENVLSRAALQIRFQVLTAFGSSKHVLKLKNYSRIKIAGRNFYT